MINGEGSGDKISSLSCLYDPVDQHDEMDGGDDGGGDVCCSSQYSSCGESDFDKYCSANSAMGTPSVCGSVGTVFHDLSNDSDFGSLKSFKLGDESSCLRSFQVNRKLSNYKGSGFCDGEMRSNVGLGEGLVRTKDMRGSSRNVVSFGENLYVGDEWRGEDELESDEHNIVNVGRSEQNVANVGADGGLSVAMGIGEGDESRRDVEQVSGGLEGLEVLSDLEYDGGEVERCSNEGETSLRDEHSEGDDSMFGYGTDDDRMIDVYHRTKIQQFKEGHHDKENKLVMTSATAFGSEDWDDFMLETGGNPLNPMLQDELLDVMKSTSLATIAADNTLDLMAQDEVHGKKHPNIQNEVRSINPTYSSSVAFPSIALLEEQENVIDISPATNQGQCAGGLAEYSDCYSMDQPSKLSEAKQWEDMKGIAFRRDNDNDININDQADDIQTSSRGNLDQDPLVEKASLENDIRGSECEKKQQHTRSEVATGVLNDIVVESIESNEKTNLLEDPLSDTAFHRPYSVSREVTEDSEAKFVKDHGTYTLSSQTDNNSNRMMQTPPVLHNCFEDYFTPEKTNTYELNEFYDEVVHDMEDILLDSSDSPGTRLTKNSRMYYPQTQVPSRDGGTTASTSGAIDAYPVFQHHLRIDAVEVVGAKQKEGDVSLSERLVGVKKYTVYVIRVWSGNSHWEVERRYRDFATLYRQLKKAFGDQGWILPSPWSSVEQESRKIFGSSSPDVVAERSSLIQECLRSILHSRHLSSSLNAVINFLSPSKGGPISTTSDTPIEQKSVFAESTVTDNILSLGKTISLVLKVQPHKSMKQLLDAQHYNCAGCHSNFNDGKTRMQDLVQTLGWGKPRLCEYSGQLFCSSCHSNDTAVLPARVLHHWDFAKYPVSQLAKSYLDSIYDQPMLCVSAVNPYLFSKVPALQHVTNIRKRIGAMLPYVRCPFRGSIYKGLGSRRYLLESSDFFALRDIVDLSKGVFAALPAMIETVSRKILVHITEQCLVCYDVGIPCNARQACDDPSSLIFPFQEGEVEKCKSCSSAFHKDCFKKVVSCPCGARFKPEEAKDSMAEGAFSTSTSRLVSSSSAGLFSGLLSKVRPQVTRMLGEQVPNDNNNVILMGSLPSTSL